MSFRRRGQSVCCARAVTGQTAVTPLTSVMKSRRRVAFPSACGPHTSTLLNDSRVVRHSKIGRSTSA
jgi:hypothetical protein